MATAATSPATRTRSMSSAPCCRIRSTADRSDNASGRSRIEGTYQHQLWLAARGGRCAPRVDGDDESPESCVDGFMGVAILIDARTGAIKVFAQEPTFAENEYLLSQIKRHCGSACKPFFYATWILKGGRLSCQDQGSGPCRLDDSYGTADGKSALSLAMGRGRRHRIQNFPYESLARYVGISEPIRCLAESRNACTMSAIRDVRAAVRGSRVPRLVYKEEILGLMNRLGIQLPTMDPERAKREGIRLIAPDVARQFGLPKDTIDPGLTVAIGSIDVSPLDMAVGLAGLMGSRVEPYAIEEIEGPSGDVVWDTTRRRLKISSRK